jgi:hypothetical protein
MSDRGPFVPARSRVGSGIDTSGDSNGPGDGAHGNRSERRNKFDYRENSHDIRHLFSILLIAFSSVPTTLFLAWIISWGIVILVMTFFFFLS